MKYFSIAFSIVLFIVNDGFAQLFDTQFTNMLNASSSEEKLKLIDFDGDEKPDILYREPLMVAMNILSPRLFDRTTIFVSHETNSPKTAIAPSLSNREGGNNADSVVLIDDNGKLELIRYIDDVDVNLFDRYNVYPYFLTRQEQGTEELFTHIYHAGFGDATHLHNILNNDLYVVADDLGEIRLFLFERPFGKLKKTPQTLSPLASYELPGAPSHFWIGDIEKDEQQKDDIFFAYDDAWEIWLASRGRKGYEPDNEERSFRFAIPEGVTKITDIVGGEDVYDLVAGVEAEAGGDVAYIVFQKEWTTSSQFIYRAVPVAIPDKHLQGGETRIFHYENKITGESHPVCIVYNRLDPQNLQANVFSIYMIDSSDPLTPQLAQTFVPEYVNDRGPYYFDKPELIGDFDNDGASDIVMAAMQYTPDWTYDPILGFKGIGSETGVSRWRLFE